MKFEQFKPEDKSNELEKLKQEKIRLLEKQVGEQIDRRTKELGRALTEAEIQQEPWFSDYMEITKLRDELAETGREKNKESKEETEKKE